MLESIHMFRKLNKWTLNEYFYRPVKIVFIQCDVKLICLLICDRQHCNPEVEERSVIRQAMHGEFAGVTP